MTTNTSPTITVKTRVRTLQANVFSMDKAEKAALIAWLEGHPQVKDVRNGGKYIDFTLVQQSGWEDRVRLCQSAPVLVWDPLEGLLHYTWAEFSARYSIRAER